MTKCTLTVRNLSVHVLYFMSAEILENHFDRPVLLVLTVNSLASGQCHAVLFIKIQIKCSFNSQSVGLWFNRKSSFITRFKNVNRWRHIYQLATATFKLKSMISIQNVRLTKYKLVFSIVFLMTAMIQLWRSQFFHFYSWLKLNAASRWFIG